MPVYSQGVLSKKTAKYGCATFVLKIPLCKILFGTPITRKADESIAKMRKHQHVGSHGTAKELNKHHRIVVSHLKKTGYDLKKLDSELTQSYFHLKNFTELH